MSTLHQESNFKRKKFQLKKKHVFFFCINWTENHEIGRYCSRGITGVYKNSFLLGASPTDIKADLDDVYGQCAVSYITIARWCKRFKERRETLEDDPLPGRPVSDFKENDVIAVKAMIEEDALYTV